MPIITDAELASYLERDVDSNLTLKTELANGIVEEFIYPDGLPQVIPTRVRAITLEVASRGVRNANGYSSETIDDYTYRRPDGTREAGIYLTKAERFELLDLGGKVANRVGSVRLTSALTRDRK